MMAQNTPCQLCGSNYGYTSIFFDLDPICKECLGKTNVKAWQKWIFRKPDPYLFGKNIRQFERERNTQALIKLLSFRRDWRVRAMAAVALAEIGGSEAIPKLVKRLGDKNWKARKYSAEALASFGWKPDNENQEKVFAIARREWKKALELKAVHTVCFVTSITGQLTERTVYPKIPDSSFITEDFPAVLQRPESYADKLISIVWDAVQTGSYYLENGMHAYDSGYLECTVEVIDKEKDTIESTLTLTGKSPAQKLPFLGGIGNLMVGSAPTLEVRNYIKSLLELLDSPLINIDRKF